MHRVCCVLAFLAVAIGLSMNARAQTAELDQTFAKLDKKLPTDVWDGKTMNIEDYDQLMEVKAFLVEYDSLVGMAQKQFDALSTEEKTPEVTERINGYITYNNEVIDAFNAKAKTIKPPWHFPFVGPQVGKDKPFVIDTLGKKWSRFWVRSIPGPRKGGKQQPSRYGLFASFAIYYAGMTSDDVVFIQPMKGSKKLGPPKQCKVGIFNDVKVMSVECDTHPGAYQDYKNAYSAGGDIQVRVIYKQVIEGKEFKDVDTFLVRLVKLPSPGTAAPSWGVSHDMELGPSTIQQYTETGVLRRWAGPIYEAWNTSSAHLPGPHLMIRTMFKSGGQFPPERAVCMHDGKRVFEGNVQGRWDAKTEAWKGNKTIVDAWRLEVVYMNGVLSRRLPNYEDVYVLAENPGEYKCVITGGGKVLKELYFDVDDKGVIKRPPCQDKSMNAPRSITLLKTKLVTPYPVKWDKKLAAKRAFAGGVTWAPGCPPTK